MNEELKPITNEQIPIPKLNNEEIDKNISVIESEKKQIIDNLPSWSIEPPIEIKRGK